MNSLQQRLFDKEKEASSTEEQLRQSIADYQTRNIALEAQVQEAQETARTLQQATSDEEDKDERLQALQTSLDDARKVLLSERETHSVTEASLEESEGKGKAKRTSHMMIAVGLLG